MIDTVNKFLELKKLAWSSTTFKNESLRLKAIAHLLDGKPETLYASISPTLKPYSFVSLWNRVIEIWDLVDAKNNPYRQFKLHNRRLFRNFYSRKELKLTFQDVKNRLDSLNDPEVKKKALDLLKTGMRYTESFTERDGYIVGKGNKVRKVYRADDSVRATYDKSYWSFYRQLKSVGLTPHMLRKIAATELVNRGFKSQDLLKVFGWSSINTAQYYLQPKQDEEIINIMGEL